MVTVSRADALRRLRFAWVHRPYTIVLAAILPIPGVLAIVVGDQVSKAFEILGTGPLSRLMGVALVVGGVVTLFGLATGKSLWEATGLTVLAAGCFVYGLGVILGLGLAGAVAGSGFLGISLGTVLRVVSLAAAAHDQINSGD